MVDFPQLLSHRLVGPSVRWLGLPLMDAPWWLGMPLMVGWTYRLWLTACTHIFVTGW